MRTALPRAPLARLQHQMIVSDDTIANSIAGRAATARLLCCMHELWEGCPAAWRLPGNRPTPWKHHSALRATARPSLRWLSLTEHANAPSIVSLNVIAG